MKKFLSGLAIVMMLGFSMGCESPEQPGDVGQQQQDTPSQEQPGEQNSGGYN